MKTKFLFFTTLAIAFSACKPIYNCGEIPPENFKASKRVMAVVEERDSLCLTLGERDVIISNLQNDVSVLKAANEELEHHYSNLIDENLSQSEQFNEAMKLKTDELKEKERLLFERERALRDLQKRMAHQDSITKRLNDVLRNALLGFKSDELSVEIKNGKVYVSMSDKLLFKSGSAAVETKGKEAIKVLAEVLAKNPDIEILVEGHTDSIPIKTELYRDNWDLSVGRATSIVRILTNDYNLPPTRITASGKGEFSPRATNATPEGRASNRRTEIILSPKLDEIMELLNQQ